MRSGSVQSRPQSGKTKPKQGYDTTSPSAAFTKTVTSGIQPTISGAMTCCYWRRWRTWRTPGYARRNRRDKTLPRPSPLPTPANRSSVSAHGFPFAFGRIGLCRSATRAPKRPWIAKAFPPDPASVGSGFAFWIPSQAMV